MNQNTHTECPILKEGCISYMYDEAGDGFRGQDHYQTICLQNPTECMKYHLNTVEKKGELKNG
jgi:hypothetical protein